MIQRINKYILTHEQSVFSFFVVGSAFLHVMLGMLIGLLSDLWVPEPLPIKARIGVRVASLPAKPTLNTNSMSTSSKSQKEVAPKLVNPDAPKPKLPPTLTEVQPSKPTLASETKKMKPEVSVTKPSINNQLSPVTSVKSTPASSKAPTPKTAAMSKPVVSKPGSVPASSKAPLRPKLVQPSLSNLAVPSTLPKASGKVTPSSKITSSKSTLLPNQLKSPAPIKLGKPVLSQSMPKLNKPILSTSKLQPGTAKLNSLDGLSDVPLESETKLKQPKLVKPSLDSLSGVALPVQPEVKQITPSLSKPKLNQKLESTAVALPNIQEPILGQIKPARSEKQQALEESSVVGAMTDQPLEGVPSSRFLMNKKMSQQAEEEYNLHISTRVIPKFSRNFEPNLFVRIRLNIMPNGEISNYEIIEKSGNSPYDQAAELAVRNAVLNPLPSILAKKPPYIVIIKVIPQS